MELLKGRALPLMRSEFLDLCATNKLRASDVGSLPYSVTERTQRLTVAFAEHRKWPDNAAIRSKILVYAGLLSHYAADLCMPLHVTVDFDGRVGPDGRSPRSGIHAKVDALLEKVPFDRKSILGDVTPSAHPDVMAAVVAQVKESQSQVDKVYALEGRLPELLQPFPADTQLRVWTQERLRVSARFMADLYLTAWEDSKRLRLPGWLKR